MLRRGLGRDGRTTPRWNTKFISHSKCVIEWLASFGQSTACVWYFTYKRETTVASVFVQYFRSEPCTTWAIKKCPTVPFTVHSFRHSLSELAPETGFPIQYSVRATATATNISTLVTAYFCPLWPSSHLDVLPF